jgi:LysR family transcriptional regulator, low CO2-responsive transcriptional regulator
MEPEPAQDTRMQLTRTQLDILSNFPTTGMSVKALAEKLGFSREWVATQMAKLEAVCNLELFNREVRPVQLTSYGLAFKQYADDFLDLLDRRDERIKAIHGGSVGVVSIFTSSTVGSYLLPYALGAFHKEYPNIEFDVRIQNRTRAHEALLADEADLAVVQPPNNTEDLQIEKFARNEVIVIAAPEHPLAMSQQRLAIAERRPISLETLSQQTMLVREPGSGTRRDIERLFKDYRRRKQIELRTSEAVQAGVAANWGITIIPRRAVLHFLKAGTVVQLKPVEAFPQVSFWALARRSERVYTKAAQNVWEFLLSYSVENGWLEPDEDDKDS